MAIHNYQYATILMGNTGIGTSAYKNYNRSHTINVNGKIAIQASADPAFLGN